MLPDWNLPFRALVDAAPDGIIVCDPGGRVVLVNIQAERMFGYGHGELVGATIETLVPAASRARHAHHVATYTAEPKLRPMGAGIDLRGQRRDGSEFPVEISLSPVTTDRGTLVIAGIRDVSDRHQLELDKQRANANLLSAVEAVQEAFLLFDERDRVVMVNSAARTMTGSVGDAPIIGRTFEDLLRSSISSRIYNLKGESPDLWFERRMAYHRAPAGALELEMSDGRVVRITERKTTDHGTVTTIADITDDVHHAAELEAARSLAEAASAAKSEFLSSMSHELRTPLNAILGFAQLLERDRKQPLSERQLERLGHVVRGGEHLLRLIDDILDLSRIEAGRIAISAEPVDVSGVISEVLHTLAPMGARAGIELSATPVPDGLLAVVADRTRLSQVLMNFASNAIKYGRPDGHVTFRVEALDTTIRIAIADDGIGIPADKHDKIFEPFQRAGQESGPIQGTGIGLTISKRLAELMRGTIGFTSEPGRGSEFWIDLPKLHESADRHELRPATGEITILATGARRHRVVYIEDNPSNIAFMRELVEDLESIELVTAPSAELGLELVRSHQPDVVIMDINLPGISGIEAVKRLRAMPETRHIPVVALSAAALTRDTARASEAGFYRYLTKPVNVGELTQVLEELLEPGTKNS